MKRIYHLIFRPLALFGAALMFCSFQAHAGYVEPRFAYGFGQLYSDLGQVRNAVIASQTNGTMKSDYWTWEDAMQPDDTSPTRYMNGIPIVYSLPVHPTQKWLDENHLPPGEHKFRWPSGSLNPICPADYQKQMTNSPDGMNIYVSCYKPDPCNCETAGNPVVISSGTKTETAIDYQGAPGLEFVRNYRSDRHGWSHNYAVKGFDTGSAATMDALKRYYDQLPCIRGIDAHFKQAYCFKQVSPGLLHMRGSNPKEFIVTRGNDSMRVFGTADNYDPALNNNDRVTRLVDAGGVTTGWTVQKSSDETIEYFDTSGKLIKTVARGGMQTLFTYSDGTTPANVAVKTGLLIRVTNHFGQQLNFTYSGDRMLTMTDPAGGVTTYAYDEASSIVTNGNAPIGNLTSVTYPDGKKRVYWYNEQDKTSGTDLPSALTGISDENGARFAIFTYDNKARAVSTEHAGGVEKHRFTPVGYLINPTHIDPLGVIWEHAYYDYNGEEKPWYKKRTIGTETVWLGSETEYDVRGNVKYKSDAKGTRTHYSYNTRNLEIQRVEVAGYIYESLATTTSWHPTYRIPVQINSPLLKTTFAHDSKGNVLTKTEQATTDTNGGEGAAAVVTGTARTWTYTYNDIGQVLTVTGPRTDVTDKTTYTYDAQGNLATVTNAAGHVTTLSNYDANSRVGQITDANGMTTTLTYAPRGWLKQRVTNADGVSEITTYDYDNVGQMTKVTLPDNSSINYVYDDAHRLTKISDSLGNSINYTLDVMGNRTNETVTDTGGNLTRQVSRVYDILNRLQKVTGAAQ